MHDVAHQRALKAPVVAVFHLLIDDSVSVILPCQTIRRLTALLHLLIGDVAGALGVLHNVHTDLGQGVLIVLQLNDLPTGGGAEAVPVGHHQCAAALDELRQLRVVDLAARDEYARPVARFRVRLARAQLLQRLSQVRQDQVLGTGKAHQVQHVELIAGDDRVFLLAQLTDLADDGTDLVVLLHRLTDSGI